jgi:hypothetical protein
VHGKWNWRDKTPGHHRHHHHHHEQDEDDDFEEFDPDELPTLLESAKVVFPFFAWRRVGRLACEEGKTEEEYGVEMEERQRRVGGFLLLFSYFLFACCFYILDCTDLLMFIIVLRHPCVHTGFVDSPGRSCSAVSC